MQFNSFDSFIAWARGGLTKGPFGLVFAEDSVELDSTIDHMCTLGFKKVIVLGNDLPDFPDHQSEQVIFAKADIPASGDISGLVNALMPFMKGEWVSYCYNAEYLYFPFSEDRSISELAAFSMEERRDAILTYVVDLYASDLGQNPSGVDRNTACLDRSGYYALARSDKWNNPFDRQMDFYGGLRWRFEEHIPETKRRIDRIAIFRVTEGLQMLQDHTFNIAEYNTYSCPWHNSITASICSFRTAKALKRNPGSTFEISTFYWHNSASFRWSSQQLMDLGLMEPGQWF